MLKQKSHAFSNWKIDFKERLIETAAELLKKL